MLSIDCLIYENGVKESCCLRHDIVLILFTLTSFENLSINMCGSDLLKINVNISLEIRNDTFNVKLASGGKIYINVPRFELRVLNATV